MAANSPRGTHECPATIVASSDDAIISKDLGGIITSWNRAAEQMFGYTAAEAIGQPIQLIVPSDLRAEEDDALARIRAGEARGHHDTVRLCKDGRLLEVSLTASAVTAPNGQIVGTSNIAHDISERKRFERDVRHLAAIVDSSDDAIVSKALDGTILSWNRAAERLFGYTASEIVGRSIRIIVPADRQAEEDHVLATVARGGIVDHFETIRLRKDGSRVPISLTVSPIRTTTGLIIGASKIARDISDRMRAEEERQRLLKLARDTSRMKDEFLATLSHELRTPLNAIVGYTRMIQAGLLTGDKRNRAIDTIARNATSLTQIVEDVLDVSRIISGKLRLEMQVVELPLLIDEAVEAMRPAAEAKGVQIETVIDTNVAPVSGDPERLRQILWNLCSNAVKFTPSGGRVRVRFQQTPTSVAVIVSDTGIGIAPEFLPYVFDRFRQADSGIDRAQGGLGLGLAISRHLVELQGGRVLVDSDGLGKGSTFRMELPFKSTYVAAPHGERQRPAATAQAPPMSVPALGGVRVLAVDDDRDALALVREVLEAAGASVTTADSGTDALEKLKRLTPNVLVADLAMPYMDGFELIDRVRHSERDEIGRLPAIALTAFARSEDRTRALRRGFQLHLAKPIEPHELMAAVDALAGRPSAKR